MTTTARYNTGDARLTRVVCEAEADLALRTARGEVREVPARGCGENARLR